MKRSFEDINDHNFKKIKIDDEFVQLCNTKFSSDRTNNIIRNSVASVGSMLATTNSDRVNNIQHNFVYTIKKNNIKATNQGHSGRCWLFAGLNSFRHKIIETLNLDDFEFSEIYLFFWDKFERSNAYINWFVDHPDKKLGDIEYNYILNDHLSDGGWWNTFYNLVIKYGLAPKDAMKETYQSGNTEDMNKIIKEQLNSTINYFRTHKLTTDQKIMIKQETLVRIYNTLVKFLGHPPKTFDWFYKNEEGSVLFRKITPLTFADIVDKCVQYKQDYIILAHIPEEVGYKYYTKYRIKYTNNVVEGKCFEILNVPIHELTKYTMLSVENGIGVWFAGDVKQSFNWEYSCLDDKLDDHKSAFDLGYKYTKADRIILRNIEGNHAMVITGFNVDKGKPTEWQVENSWGYIDASMSGQDGFLSMSHSWFVNYVTEVAIRKDMLSRHIIKYVEQECVEINPWDTIAPALRVK